jgi:hypothetical protein
MWEDHLAGKETSMNPLGMVEALIGAMQHAAELQGGNEAIMDYTLKVRKLMHTAMASGYGTRDLCGPAGLTTEQFVDHIARGLSGKSHSQNTEEALPHAEDIDMESIEAMFKSLDVDGNGVIDMEEFTLVRRRAAAHPRTRPSLSRGAATKRAASDSCSAVAGLAEAQRTPARFRLREGLVSGPLGPARGRGPYLAPR